MFGYIRIIRVYGMEGAAAEEGEAQTRNIESSYRRPTKYNAVTRRSIAELGPQALLEETQATSRPLLEQNSAV